MLTNAFLRPAAPTSEREPLLPRFEPSSKSSQTSGYSIASKDVLLDSSRVTAAYLQGMYRQSVEALHPGSPNLRNINQSVSPLESHFICRGHAAVALSLTLASNLTNEARNYALPLMGSNWGLVGVTLLPLVQTAIAAEAAAATSRWAAACSINLNNDIASMVAKSGAVAPDAPHRQQIANKLLQMQRIQKEHCATLSQLTMPAATFCAAAVSLACTRGSFVVPLTAAIVGQWLVEELVIKKVRTRYADRIAASRVDVSNHLSDAPDALHDGVAAWQKFMIQHSAKQQAQASAEGSSERANLLTASVGIGLMFGTYMLMGWLAPVSWDAQRRATIATAVTAGSRLSFVLQPLCKQRTNWSTNIAHGDALIDEVQEVRGEYQQNVPWNELSINGSAHTPHEFMEALHVRTPGTWTVSGTATNRARLKLQLELYRDATQLPLALKGPPGSPSSTVVRVSLDEMLDPSLRSRRMSHNQFVVRLVPHDAGEPEPLSLNE